jgi:hypothetical protein
VFYAIARTLRLRDIAVICGIDLTVEKFEYTPDSLGLTGETIDLHQQSSLLQP